MKHLLFFVILGLVALSCNKTDKKPLPLMKVNYPETKTIDHTDNYFDSIVSDPYRWLEDDRSTETGEWVKSQNEVSFDYLNKIHSEALSEKGLLNYGIMKNILLHSKKAITPIFIKMMACKISMSCTGKNEKIRLRFS